MPVGEDGLEATVLNALPNLNLLDYVTNVSLDGEEGTVRFVILDSPQTATALSVSRMDIGLEHLAASKLSQFI